MLYAKIVVGLPIDGPFDYIVPPELAAKISVGSRVLVSFSHRKLAGFVVGLVSKSKIPRLKNIISVLDVQPLLSQNLLLLTRQLSEYYCCSWGEAIEVSLPEKLRKPKPVECIRIDLVETVPSAAEALLLHDPSGKQRFSYYIEYIKEARNNKKSVITLFSDIKDVSKFAELLANETGIDPVILSRHEKTELDAWLKIREDKFAVAIGTRSAIFAPFNNLGLIIIDEEDNFAYKQDQSPHYNARQIAFMRAAAEGARLVLCSTNPSLESIYLTRQSKLKYIRLQSTDIYPEVKIVDMKGRIRIGKLKPSDLSRYLQDIILQALNSGEKVLLFMNRTGFATAAHCQHCGLVLRCPRCSVNLTYHFKEGILACHRCNFKMPPPKICPECNSGYIKYSGMGTEKMESEVARIFPQARIRQVNKEEAINLDEADIFISTKGIIHRTLVKFDIVGVLGIDIALNRPELSASENVFGILTALAALTKKKMIVQTNIPEHQIFKAVEMQNYDLFFDAELSQRRQLGFPPYQHLGLIKVRGINEARVQESAEKLFEKLKKNSGKAGLPAGRQVSIVSMGAANPIKLRGNFYWHILIKAADPLRISKFIKNNLKDFPHSGIIVTVDIDPI